MGGRLSDRSDGPELDVKYVIGFHESDESESRSKESNWRIAGDQKSRVMQDSENYRMVVAKLDTSMVGKKKPKAFSFCMRRINQF